MPLGSSAHPLVTGDNDIFEMTEEAGLQPLDAFAGAWDSRYPQISRSRQSNWANLATFFAYSPDIRKVIYTEWCTGSFTCLGS
jgi:transposase-like protein